MSNKWLFFVRVRAAIWNIAFKTPLIVMDRWTEDRDGETILNHEARWRWSRPAHPQAVSSNDKTIWPPLWPNE